jgi:hypothetical protein
MSTKQQRLLGALKQEVVSPHKPIFKVIRERAMNGKMEKSNF